MIPAQRAYTMPGNESLWGVATRCHELFRGASIPYAIVGDVAVCLHGYQRNTVDLDLLVRASESAAIRKLLEEAGFSWSEEHAEFRSPTGIPVQLLLAAERTGVGSEVLLPDPADEAAVTHLEGLTVVTLARLIESKLACGQGNLRRTHKDFADVVELIVTNQLSRSFTRHLHKSLRPAFRELVIRARGGK